MLIRWLYRAVLICWVSKRFPLEQLYLHKHCRTKGTAKLQLSLAGQSWVGKKLSAVYCKGEDPGKDAMKGWIQSTFLDWALKLKFFQRHSEAKPFCCPFQMLPSGLALYFHSDALSHLYWLSVPFPLLLPLENTVWSHLLVLLTRPCSLSFLLLFCYLLLITRFASVCAFQFAMTLFLLMQGSTPWCGWALASWGQAFGFLSDRMLSTVQGSTQSNMICSGQWGRLISWWIAIWARQVVTKPISCL